MKKRLYVIGYIYIILSIFFISSDSLSRGIGKEYINSLYDLGTVYQVDINGNFGIRNFIRTNSQVKSENELLKKQIELLQQKNNSNLTLQKEIEDLKPILNYQTSTDRKLVTSKVLGFENFPAQSLLIDKGENDGISTGDIALDPIGNVIGVIKEAKPNYSQITLVSSLDFVLNVTDKDSNSYILQNKNQTRLHIRSIEQVNNNTQPPFSGVLLTSNIFNHGGEFPVALIEAPLEIVDSILTGEVVIISSPYDASFVQVVTKKIEN